MLAVLAAREARRYGPRSSRDRRVALAAGVFFAADLTFWHYAIGYVGAGLATVLANSQVVLVGIIAWLVLGERPRPRTLELMGRLLAVLLLLGAVGCSPRASDGAPEGMLVSDPLPAEEACTYESYEAAVRGFSAAVEEGDVEVAQEFLADAHELRYLHVAADDRRAEEREFDLDALVEFVDAAGGERLRLHTLFVNSVAGLGGEIVEREFLARVADWPGLVRGNVACVDGQARLDQWLVIEAPVEETDWPCDERSNGACYRYAR